MTAITTSDPAPIAAGATTTGRARSAVRAAISLLVFALVYEAVARSGYFPAVLMPTLGKVGNTLLAGLLDGSILAHAAATMYRVLIGMGLAVVVALPLGILMGRFKPVEHFFLPLASASGSDARVRTSARTSM